MNKLILAVAFGLASLASVAAQVNSVAVSSQVKELMADGSLGRSRERVLNDKLPREDADAAPLLNHSASRNVTSNNVSDTSATKTRLRVRAATPMTATPSALALNQIYRVGIGDVLDVQLLDVPTAKSTLFTVLEGGVLDYPLSNTPVPVAGLTADEIAEQLRTRIKVLDNPKVAVKVRDYSSHSVIVTGFVLDPGARFLRREATPLYVVLAEARPRPEVVRATIARNGAPLMNIELKDQNALATLVMPGDVIKVLAPPAEPRVFFYSGGALNAPGQKAFHDGLTLTQAILASGGVTRTAGTKVRVSRQGADGRLTSTEYNLQKIEEGKSQDPLLQPGDRLAVGEGR